ncbi:MAG: hypothetical protein CMH57_03770 [Myxococcales bacterium]|nr:hypothetical protein [Myxococcales bacterium]
MSSKNLTRSLARLLALLLGVAFLALACGEPPTKALEDAENSLLEAASVSECAEEEFRKAEEALAKAKQLVEEGEYDEAAIQAAKAKQLADNAKAAGEANWDDCQKAKNPPDTEGQFEVALDKMETVYFDFNESALTDEAKKKLQKNVEWMKRRPEAKVRIEGHCDEQGTTDYNLALGELRGQTVRKYMMQLGIKPDRLAVVSYGSELPVDLGLNADAYAKNRRAEFKVLQ